MNIIYKITNILTEKSYIGKKTGDKKLFESSDYFGSGKIIKRAIKKYGRKNFIREVIGEFRDEEINEMEIFYIGKFNTLQPHGYNITEGGNGGNTRLGMTEDQKIQYNKRLSKSAPKNKSDEHKENIRKSHMGLKRTWYSPGNLGNTHSDEFKKRQAIRTKNRRWYTNGKTDIYINLNSDIPKDFYPGRSIFKNTKYGTKKNEKISNN